MNFKNWILFESKYTFKDVLRLAKQAKISNNEIDKYNKNQLVMGINVEKEHMKDKDIDVVKNVENRILKIALAHLREDDKYYEKLKKIENKKLSLKN